MHSFNFYISRAYIEFISSEALFDGFFYVFVFCVNKYFRKQKCSYFEYYNKFEIFK